MEVTVGRWKARPCGKVARPSLVGHSGGGVRGDDGTTPPLSARLLRTPAGNVAADATATQYSGRHGDGGGRGPHHHRRSTFSPLLHAAYSNRPATPCPTAPSRFVFIFILFFFFRYTFRSAVFLPALVPSTVFFSPLRTRRAHRTVPLTAATAPSPPAAAHRRQRNRSSVFRTEHVRIIYT